MAKPNIGDLTPAGEKSKKREKPKYLTVLKKDSKDTIFSLLFSELQKQGIDKL